jgi:hypothetical protein
MRKFMAHFALSVGRVRLQTKGHGVCFFVCLFSIVGWNRNAEAFSVRLLFAAC